MSRRSRDGVPGGGEHGELKGTRVDRLNGRMGTAIAGGAAGDSGEGTLCEFASQPGKAWTGGGGASFGGGGGGGFFGPCCACPFSSMTKASAFRLFVPPSLFASTSLSSSLSLCRPQPGTASHETSAHGVSMRVMSGLSFSVWSSCAAEQHQVVVVEA